MDQRLKLSFDHLLMMNTNTYSDLLQGLLFKNLFIFHRLGLIELLYRKYLYHRRDPIRFYRLENAYDRE